MSDVKHPETGEPIELYIINQHRAALGYKPFKEGEVKDLAAELERVEQLAEYGSDPWG